MMHKTPRNELNNNLGSIPSTNTGFREIQVAQIEIRNEYVFNVVSKVFVVLIDSLHYANTCSTYLSF
jgi:hypothetical protein